MLAAHPRILLGGGRAYWIPQGAAGPRAKQARGVLDNTDLYGIMRQTLGLRGD